MVAKVAAGAALHVITHHRQLQTGKETCCHFNCHLNTQFAVPKRDMKEAKRQGARQQEQEQGQAEGRGKREGAVTFIGRIISAPAAFAVSQHSRELHLLQPRQVSSACPALPCLLPAPPSAAFSLSF